MHSPRRGERTVIIMLISALCSDKYLHLEKRLWISFCLETYYFCGHSVKFQGTNWLGLNSRILIMISIYVG